MMSRRHPTKQHRRAHAVMHGLPDSNNSQAMRARHAHDRRLRALRPYRLQSRYRHSLGAKLTLLFVSQAVLVALAVRLFDHHGSGWGWAAAGVMLITLMAYASIRHTLRPLRALAAGAAAFGRGELQYRIHVHHRDEIGDLADRFNQMAQDISAMLDAKRELLLAISHELRSPLTRARLHAELLEERGPTHDGLLHELGLMRDLIEDLLERERLDGGHASLRVQDTDLHALVHELCERRFAGALSQDQLRVQMADELPARVRLDKTRVQLMLGNLLDNALRHNAPQLGPVTLQVWAAAGQLHCQVRDQGPGVPPQALSQLGQAFFRPESARSRDAGGIGLGLNLCMLVAQAHGGQLLLRNAQPGFEAHATLPCT